MTDPTAALREELAELVRDTEPKGIGLVLIGGLGVLLRVERVVREKLITLAQAPGDDEPMLPVARATRDLDLMLGVEVIVDPAAMASLRQILDARGYEPIATAEYYQFKKVSPGPHGDLTIKVDLFAEEPADGAAVKRDDRRIRPRGYRELHAHRAREAIAIEESSVIVRLTDEISIATPNLFSFWLLKLFALRDRIESKEADEARVHAYDLYALWAATAKNDWTAAAAVSSRYQEHAIVLDANAVAEQLFGSAESFGTIRLLEALRERSGETNDDLVGRFRSDLVELLSGGVV